MKDKIYCANRRRASIFVSLFLFISACAALRLSSDCYAKKIRMPEIKSGEDFIDHPTVKYEEGDGGESQDVYRMIHNGELVFTGKLDSVIRESPGPMPMPISFLRIKFKEIEMVKGSDPKRSSFLYTKDAKDLELEEGKKYLVVLARVQGDLQIDSILPYSAANRSLAQLEREAK